MLHGGAPAALLAYGVEQARAPGLQPARMTIDLFRPVPKAPLELRTQEVRTGRRIQVLETSLWHEGREMCRATNLLLRPADVTVPETAHFPQGLPADPATLPTGSLMPEGMRRRGAPPGLHTTIEVKRITPPNTGEGGHHAAWIRIPVQVVEGEPNTPLVRVAGVSDFGNGLANIRIDDSAGFINADINLHLHREPVGEWVCLDAHSSAGDNGLGLIRTTLYDEVGPIGYAVQAIMANPRAD
ncbi:MAG: thioesterase family protein [Dehalococcoidia bacterium]|nr:thioesterase family protein [Dehalococcoidia bacterium]